MFIPPPLNSILTGNEIGYSWSSSTKADAQFKVPDFPWRSPLSKAERENHTVLALWSGLSSPSSPYIEQIGIYDHVNPAGKVNWQGVYAFWPEEDKACGGLISPGDTLFTTVVRTSGYHYTMTLRDAGPHHVWTFKVSKAFGHIENQGMFIAEDTQYPGYPSTPITGFQPTSVLVSGNPTTRFDVTPRWGYASRVNNHEITLHG